MLHDKRYQTEIAAELKIDKAQVSRFVKTLRELGLIKEDVTEFEYKGKIHRQSGQLQLVPNKFKCYIFSSQFQEYIESLDLKKETDFCLYNIHHIQLRYAVTEQPDRLYLKEVPQHPEVHSTVNEPPDRSHHKEIALYPKVDYVSKWKPTGQTRYRFEVMVSESVTISIIYHGSSILASRMRKSRFIRASNGEDLMKIWKDDVKKGVDIFIKYQEKHGKKISVGTPEVRGKPHYSMLTKDGNKIAYLPNKTLPDDIYIDNSPAKINPGISEIETENYDVAEKFDRALRCASRMPEHEDRIDRIEKELTRQTACNRKLSQENADLRLRLTVLEQSAQKS